MNITNKQITEQLKQQTNKTIYKHKYTSNIHK